ncbi:MAG: Rpp14/Pop5 family protein [Candidatus Caldarchaeales archaeon]
MRAKRRYLGVKVRSRGDPPDPAAVHGAVLNALERLYGQIESARANLKLAWSDESKGELVLRCSLSSVWRVVLAASSVSEVGGVPVALDVVTASGSIRKVKERLRAQARHS